VNSKDYRERAERLMLRPRFTTKEVAEADVWARLATAAAITEAAHAAPTWGDDHDGMTTDDLFTGDELREMEQADEARMDAEDDARHSAEEGV